MDIFGHIRTSRTEFTSTVLVEDIYKDLDVYAICIARKYIDDLPIIRDHLSQDENDRRRIAYSQAVNKNIGRHCGDCTCAPASCERCIAEYICEQGLEMIKEAKNVNDSLSLLDILCVLLATEEPLKTLEENYSTAVKNEYHNIKVPAAPRCSDIYDELEKYDKFSFRLEQWNKLDIMSQKEAMDRALKFRNYLNDEVIVDGITWW